MTAVLTDLDQATPAWLTETLKVSGDLTQGQVVAVTSIVESSSSQVAHLALTYSDDAPMPAPRHLLLKIADPELEERMPQRNKREIVFYSHIAPRVRDLPVVRCYAAAYRDGAVDNFLLLLDDPSATTHVAQKYSQVPPPLEQCERILDVLAQVHARLWNSPVLGGTEVERDRGEQHTGEATPQFATWATATMPRFIAALDDRIPSARRTVYERIGDRLVARLREREAGSNHLTLIQGDVHPGNFLMPRDAKNEWYIIDWKRATRALGASDLSYMMALYWFPQVRSRWEVKLLRHYHERLMEHGVEHYSWDDLWLDYRLCVMKQLFEAVWGWSVGQNSMIWWNHLERISVAIEDLNCLELL